MVSCFLDLSGLTSESDVLSIGKMLGSDPAARFISCWTCVLKDWGLGLRVWGLIGFRVRGLGA